MSGLFVLGIGIAAFFWLLSVIGSHLSPILIAGIALHIFLNRKKYEQRRTAFTMTIERGTITALIGFTMPKKESSTSFEVAAELAFNRWALLLGENNDRREMADALQLWLSHSIREFSPAVIGVSITTPEITTEKPEPSLSERMVEEIRAKDKAARAIAAEADLALEDLEGVSFTRYKQGYALQGIRDLFVHPDRQR